MSRGHPHFVTSIHEQRGNRRPDHARSNYSDTHRILLGSRSTRSSSRAIEPRPCQPTAHTGINREMDLNIPRTSANHARCVARSAPWNAATVSMVTQLRVSSTPASRRSNPRARCSTLFVAGRLFRTEDHKHVQATARDIELQAQLFANGGDELWRVSWIEAFEPGSIFHGLCEKLEIHLRRTQRSSG